MLSFSGTGFTDEDGKELEPFDKLTGKKRSKGSDSGKVDDDGHPTKLKRKGRVTIEVTLSTFMILPPFTLYT